MSVLNERIYDVRHSHDSDHVVHVEDDASNLALTIIDGDEVGTIKLDVEGAKKLRLAIQRFERSQT